MDINQRKPHLNLTMGGFNVRSLVWWSDGSNIIEGIKLSLLISCSGFK